MSVRRSLRIGNISGTRLSITTATVISLGRSRWTAPSITAAETLLRPVMDTVQRSIHKRNIPGVDSALR
jgi:hypothetical protein